MDEPPAFLYTMGGNTVDSVGHKLMSLSCIFRQRDHTKKQMAVPRLKPMNHSVKKCNTPRRFKEDFRIEVTKGTGSYLSCLLRVARKQMV